MQTFSSPNRRARQIIAWLAAALVPAGICAVTVSRLDRVLNIAGQSALFFVGVLVVALLGGIAPAVVSAVFSGLLLNYFLTEPRHTLRIADVDTAVTLVVMLVMAVAVAALVDSATTRQRQARLAGREAELLRSFADSVLSGADVQSLLDRVRRTYDQTSVALLHEGGGGLTAVAQAGTSPAGQSAKTVIPETHGEFRLELRGTSIPATDRRLLAIVAGQAGGLVRQQALAEEAGKAQAIEKADELRRSLLTAVGHDLRTPLAGAKAAVSSLRADDIHFSEQDTAELLATVEESVDQLTALVDNLLDSSRLAAGAVHPELRRTYLDEVVARAVLGIRKGSAVSGSGPLDLIKVDVADAVVMADPGLLERVMANLIDNAVRYADGCPVRVTASRGDDRVDIAVIDEGPGVPHGSVDQLFEPFQRPGDRNNKTGVGLGLSVARGFVEAMGGSIRAVATPGGGLTVVVGLLEPNGDASR